MATHRISAPLRATVLTVVALVALVGMPVLLAVPGEATPTLTIAQVETRVAQLDEEAAIASEKRNSLKARADQTAGRIAKVRQRITTQQEQLDSVRGQLGVFAAAAYRTGGIDSTLQLMLSDDPATFLDQSSSLDAVARGQQAAMRQVAAAQQNLDQSKAELAQTLTSQKAVADEAAQYSAEIQSKADEAERLLSSLKAEERARLEAAQAARAAAAARASRAAADRAVASLSTGGGGGGGNAGGNGGGGGGSSAGSSAPSYNGPASGRAAKAVAFALSKVGGRYVWGGEGPGYDCSGLTMMAWRQAGVSLPHYTVAQYNATRKVSRANMQPGDLIFFHSDMHHMGMYIGGGQFVHAQSSATGIVISPIAGHWSSRITGVTRP